MRSDATSRTKQLEALQRLRVAGRLDPTLTRMMNRLEQEADESRALEGAISALDEEEARAKAAPEVRTASADPQPDTIALLTIDVRGCGWALPAARIRAERRLVAYRLRPAPGLHRFPRTYWNAVRGEVTRARPITQGDVFVIEDASSLSAVVDAVIASGSTYREQERAQLERDVVAYGSAADCEAWFKAEPNVGRDLGGAIEGSSSPRVRAAERRDLIRRRLGQLGELARIDEAEAARENARNSRVRRAG